MKKVLPKILKTLKPEHRLKIIGVTSVPFSESYIHVQCSSTCILKQLKFNMVYTYPCPISVYTPAYVRKFIDDIYPLGHWPSEKITPRMQVYIWTYMYVYTSWPWFTGAVNGHMHYLYDRGHRKWAFTALECKEGHVLRTRCSAV